jgi:hypothetical protein
MGDTESQAEGIPMLVCTVACHRGFSTGEGQLCSMKRIQAATRAECRRWLSEYHNPEKDGFWLIFPRKKDRDQAVASESRCMLDCLHHGESGGACLVPDVTALANQACVPEIQIQATQASCETVKATIEKI